MMRKKIYIISLLFLGCAESLFAATIRVYNKTTKPLKIVTKTTKASMIETIPPMRSHFFNTWFNGINGFEWENRGQRCEANLSMRALQTQGCLYIKRDGQYSFKPCLPCKETRGVAKITELNQTPQMSLAYHHDHDERTEGAHKKYRRRYGRRKLIEEPEEHSEYESDPEDEQKKREEQRAIERSQKIQSEELMQDMASGM